LATKANIVKANLSVANLDLNHYQDYRLTLAQHPSETGTRLMIRLAAFSWFAQEEPSFTKGLCVEDEPDLWVHDLQGNIQHWIELGQPTEKRIRQAASKAEQVSVIGYHPHKFKTWLAGLDPKTLNQKKLSILLFENQGPADPEELAEKAIDLNVTIQENQVLLTTQTHQLTYQVTLIGA